jgi:hypothetical protein
MLKFIFIILLSNYALCSYCFAERYIVPTKYDYQEEVLIQGASIIVSKKHNTVSMYQTSETIIDNKANFYFSVSNHTNKSINLFFSSLKITDQSGRQIKVVHKNELISNKKSKKNWEIFASALCCGLDSMNAQNAGRIDYQSHTNSNFNSNFNAHGSNGWVAGSVNGYSSSTTHGTIHCEALRQQALAQAQQNASYRNNLIEGSYASWEYGLNNFYFDSTTVFSDLTYSTNFQIEIPSDVEKELQYMMFSFEIENETHTFCFYCGEEVKKWYHF